MLPTPGATLTSTFRAASHQNVHLHAVFLGFPDAVVVHFGFIHYTVLPPGRCERQRTRDEQSTHARLHTPPLCDNKAARRSDSCRRQASSNRFAEQGNHAGFSTVQTEAQIGPPILKVAAARGFRTCSCGRLAEQLERAPADHGDARRADRMALGDQPARRVDSALAVRPRLAVHPILRPPALPALPITSVPSAPITVKQSCTSATLTSAAVTPAIAIRLGIARYAPAGRSTSPPGHAQGVRGLPIAGDFHALRLSARRVAPNPVFGGENQRRVAVGDLRTVVGLERQPIHHVAVEAFDAQRLFQRDLRPSSSARRG